MPSAFEHPLMARWECTSVPATQDEADIRNYQKCLISFYESEARYFQETTMSGDGSSVQSVVCNFGTNIRSSELNLGVAGAGPISVASSK